MGTVSAASRRRWYIYITVFAVLCMVSLIADRFTVHNPELANLMIAKKAPCREYLMGTDWLGRCIACRIIAGAKSSIFASLVIVILSMAFGCILGIISGYAGGRVDEVLMRIVDIFLAFPGLVFALAVAAALGGGVHNAIIALAAISWPKYARVARSQTLAQKETVYIRAARLSGCGTGKLILKHILPNIFGPILVTAMLDIGTMMMELAGLSFLGLGAKPPVAEWGSMMSDTRNLLTTHPWVTLAPGFAIFVSVVIFNLLGDTVRDWLDPRNGR